MFHTAKIIVTVTRSKILVSSIKSAVPPVIEKHQEFESNSQPMAEVFSIIGKNYGSHIRILLSDEFVYITSIKSETPQTATRKTVQSAAQEFIPEDMSKTSWDYRVYPQFIQVAVLNKSMFDQITEAVKKAGITIEAIEPCSSALARTAGAEKEPVLIIFESEIASIIAAQDGAAISAEVIHEPLTSAHIEKAVNFIRDQFQLPIKKIIKTEKTGDIFNTEFFKDITIESKILDPAIGMLNKTDIAVPDERSLNLELDSSPESKKHGIPRSSYLLFFSAFILTACVYFLIQYFTVKSKNTQSLAISPTAVPIPATPTASPSAAIKKDYSIRILNASGIQGEAGRLREQLAENNFTVSSTGNASNAKPEISVHYSAAVDDVYLNELDNVLKTIYTTVTTEPKLASDEADITIIIGPFKPK